MNATMRDHLSDVATTAVDTLGRVPERVLDIGCNDGTLLRAFVGMGARDVWGVEPSNASADMPAGMNVRQSFFPFDESDATPLGQFDIVTSIAMFYDVDDPLRFARAIERTLAPGGIWVVEVAYLPTMLANVGYDTVCHEHLSYFSFETLERAIAAAGLEVISVVLNDINGASIRCLARRKGEVAPADRNSEAIARVRRSETDARLGDPATYERFAATVETHRRELRELLKLLRAKGCSIHVYGASTKGNTVLQYCGLDASTIDCAADRNPMKVGGRTLGSDIPIVSEEESRLRRPDYYLVLPWHFRDEILERERATIAAGTAMIFPLPNVELVTG